MIRWLPMLVVLIALGADREAQAGGKVDWSQYLEPPGARTPVNVKASASEQPVKASATKRKASRSAAKKQSAKAKAKKTKKRRR